MKKIYILLFAIFLFPLAVSAEVDLYSEVSELSIIKDGFEVVKTPTGIDLNSINKFKNSKGKIEPVTHLMLEGPLIYKQINDIQQGIFAAADAVRLEVDETYKNYQELYPGLGTDLSEINGVRVCILNYKMNREPNTFVRRAIMYTEKGLYTYTIIMHHSGPKSTIGKTLDVILITSVNSGKL